MNLDFIADMGRMNGEWPSRAKTVCFVNGGVKTGHLAAQKSATLARA